MDRARIAGPLVAFAFFAAFATHIESVHAQQGASLPAESQSPTYFATVTADNVYVRSGPSVQSSYPFGKMDRGEVVRVVEENFGWARVQTAGRAFADMNGFIPVDDRAQLSVDGATITANATTELRAPNISADSTPDSSWKQIGRIEAGATLAVIARIDAERGSVWSVRLPEMGEGWINSNFLRRSTAAEAVAFDKAVVNEEIATIATEGAMIAVSSEPTEPVAVIAEIVEVEMKPAKPTKTPEQIATELRRATFADLEVAWLKIKGQPTAEAEVGALYARYIVFAAECKTRFSNCKRPRLASLVNANRSMALPSQSKRAANTRPLVFSTHRWSMTALHCRCSSVCKILRRDRPCLMLFQGMDSNSPQCWGLSLESRAKSHMTIRSNWTRSLQRQLTI